MLNKVILQGRCGSNPELRMTGSGVPVTTVSLAVDRDFKNGDGNKETDWIDVVAWRETAKFLADRFAKGSMILVSGRLQIRSWADKDGNKRRSAEVLADNVYFGEAKKSDSYTSGYSTPVSASDSTSIPAQDFAPLLDEDGLLPF